MLKPRLSEQDLVDRAAARKNRSTTFTEAYANHRKDLAKWSLFFILMFALLASLPFVAWMYGLLAPK